LRNKNQVGGCGGSDKRKNLKYTRMGSERSGIIVNGELSSSDTLKSDTI
ncbi:unnamed protein product, partial [Allacma fusca]